MQAAEGCRVKVFSKREQAWKNGVVQGFRAADGRFRVVYNDNSEYWETLSESGGAPAPSE